MNALTINKVYLETTGAFYQGGPALTTRLGDLEVDYSPYIAHISETDGVIEASRQAACASALLNWQASTDGLPAQSEKAKKQQT